MRRTVAVLLTLAAACADGGGGADDVVIRDSAGVVIVESRAADVRAPFVIAPEPVVSIGAPDGPAAYAFRSVTDADRLPDGRILVADLEAVRIYGPDGVHQVTAGRAGRGPGEFARVWNAELCGSEIVVGDTRRAYLTVFDADGGFLRTEPLPAPDERFPLFLLACDGDGRPLLNSPMASLPEHDPGRPFLAVTRLDTATGAVDTLVRVPAVPRPLGFPPPFSTFTLLAYGDSLLHAVDTGSPEVRSYGLDGRLRRIARLPMSPRPVTPAELERDIDSTVASYPGFVQAEIRAQLEAARAPETMPVVTAMEVDETGRVWLRPFTPRGEPPDSLWWVVDTDGTLLGRAAIPTDFAPHHIGADWVLGVWEDALDVQYVRLHRLAERVTR